MSTKRDDETSFNPPRPARTPDPAPTSDLPTEIPEYPPPTSGDQGGSGSSTPK